jgi:hypothetical protein
VASPLFMDDFHQLLGKACAKERAPALPQFPQRGASILTVKKETGDNFTGGKGH